MRFAHLVAFAAAAVAISAADDTLRIDGWFNCSANTLPSSNERHNTMPVHVECALVEVPLCHTFAICESDHVIQVFVKRMLATQETTKDIWVLQGGPGASSIAMEYMMLDLFTVTNGAVNLYTMDHRGTGRSAPLECIAAQATTPGSVEGPSIAVTEYPNCIRDVRFQIDNHTRAFSITSAAMDLQVLSSTFRASWTATDAVPSNNSPRDVYVYGASYGTLLLERLMQLEPTHIRGYVLDGVVAQINHTFATFDIDINVAGARFIEKCSADAFCRGKLYGRPSLADALAEIYTRLDTRVAPGRGTVCHPFANWTSTPPSYKVRWFLTQMFMNVRFRAFIPAIVRRLLRCDPRDEIVLAFAHKSLSPNEAAITIARMNSYQEPNYGSTDMLYHLIVYSEEWPHPTPTKAELQRVFESSPLGIGVHNMVDLYCLFTGRPDSACNATTPTSPTFTYTPDAYFNRTAAIPRDATVLFMSGTLDPQTEIAHGRAQFEKLHGTEKRWLEFPDAPHCAAFQTPMTTGDIHCGVYVVASYLAANGRLDTLNTTCLDHIQPLSFEIEPKAALAFLGTDDAYDGGVHSDASVVIALKEPGAMSDPEQVSLLLALACLAMGGLLAFAVTGRALWNLRVGPLQATAIAVEFSSGVGDA
ncbi:Aste57867_25219 [Aphanomyces stellatus]|uniref:Aste57867_25219 protein n=1 Tax=Aphanomyces stellatus TaxID=120398 RepID=A0A485LSI8_9STRA|nr:hypothetical protein As57867_025141 [Aphanomyces stellatus]VFU01846.1 Aste57867_25219 [Aphanomyces stellatus]